MSFNQGGLYETKITDTYGSGSNSNCLWRKYIDCYVEDLEARVTQLETRLNQSTVAPRVTTLEKKINIICDEVKLYSQDNPVFSSWFGYDPARIITGVQHREVPINAKHMMNNHNHEHEIYINKELCR